MKKLVILFSVLSLCFNNKAMAQKQALVLGYAQGENVYEDENIKAELIRLDLRVTNKTNKTVYIDKKSSFYYINEEAYCLYEGKETHYSNGVTKIEKETQAIAPKGKTTFYYNAPINGTYNAGGGVKGKGLIGKLLKKAGALDGTSNILEDMKVELMGYVETLRFELANNQDQSCSVLHLTGDESFLNANISFNYTTDPKMESFTPVTLVTWVSDMIMSKYYVQPKDKIERTNAVNVQGRMYNILHVFADSPFEYDEDDSPLDMYTVQFGQGWFKIHQFNNIIDEGADKVDKKDKKDEMMSNFGEKPKYKNIFVWEGQSTNWVQALTDSYAKFLEEDGEKPKNALEEAKKKAKECKKDQTLQP